MRMWWTKRTPDRRQQIGERLTQIFVQSVWTAELRAEAERLRAELLALDDVPAPELPPAAARRAVADPEAEARRTAEREAEAERRRWGRLVAMRAGGGMSRVVYQPERDAARSALRRQGREHAGGLVRDGFNPWR